MRGTASRGTLRSEVKEEAEGRGTRAEKSPPVSRAFTGDDATRCLHRRRRNALPSPETTQRAAITGDDATQRSALIDQGNVK